MANKTAMQILLDLIDIGNLNDLYQVSEYIKHIGIDMERNQTIEAGNICGNMLIANDIVIMGDHSLSVGENYYNETYGKES